MERSKRSGNYRDTGEGYIAFFPSAIPQLEDIDIGGGLLQRLSDANRALGKLDGISGMVPDQDLFVMMYLKKEAVLSSQIEGTQASLMDILEFEGRMLDPGNKKDLTEVLDYIAALRIGIDRSDRGERIDLSMILDLHGILMKDSRGGDLRPGEFRKVQNWIGSRDGTLGDAVFVPPPPDAMMGSLKDLEVHLGGAGDIPILVRVALVHAWFESIHPFLDGNGRMGRLLITLLLHQEKALGRPMLYLSHYFKRNRSRYYDRLQAVREEDDIEGWLEFFFGGIISVSNEAHVKIMRITQLKERCRREVVGRLGKLSPEGSKVLDSLMERPIVNVNSVMDITGLSYPSASRIVQEMEAEGILSEVTGNKRNRVFEFTQYLDILEE